MDIMTYIFDEENNKRLFGLEQRRLGKIEGKLEGKIEGKLEGKIEGKLEGKIEGKLEEKKRIAIELLNMNMDIPQIEQITGLSKAEILKLKELS